MEQVEANQRRKQLDHRFKQPMNGGLEQNQRSD
jgi:hypothetical protein